MSIRAACNTCGWQGNEYLVISFRDLMRESNGHLLDTRVQIRLFGITFYRSFHTVKIEQVSPQNPEGARRFVEQQ